VRLEHLLSGEPESGGISLEGWRPESAFLPSSCAALILFILFIIRNIWKRKKLASVALRMGGRRD
jgi:hypothetical protein